MGIYIKNIKMPTNCMECKFTDSEYCTCVLMEFYDDDYYVGCYSIERAPWCPLVPVPPHGRLIDKDALEYDISHSVVFSGKLHNPEIIGANKIINRIHHAPTIIEAEVDDG